MSTTRSRPGVAKGGHVSAGLEPGRGLTDHEAVRLLTGVVANPSPSGHERGVAELLVAAARGWARDAFVDPVGNAVAVWGKGPLNVTFLGHMDTVPGEIPVRVEDGVLHGRGSVDAKGSLCAALVAATRLPVGVWERLSFTFIGAVEEEAPSSRGARYAVTAHPAPDLVIVGEPSGWERYTLGYKGRLGVTFTARRGGAHSSREEATAAEAAVDAFTCLRDWVERDNEGVERLFERLQVSLIAMDSGGDGLEEWCRARVSLRLPPRWSGAALAGAIAGLPLPSGVTMDLTEPLDAFRSDNGSDLARAFRVAIRSVGGSPRPSLKTGTSDMNVVAPHWNAPMVAYGPGDSNLDHTPEERLVLREYLLAVDVLERVMLELAGQAGPPKVAAQ